MASASRTEICLPSVSTTLEYRVKIAIPGPMAACAKSTGATLPRWRRARAAGSSALSAFRNSRRVAADALSARIRQTRTMLEASAFDPVSLSYPVARFERAKFRRQRGRNESLRQGSLHPVLVVPSFSSRSALLKCIIDRDRECWMCLLAQAMHRICHSSRKNFSALSRPPCRTGVATNSPLWHCYSRKKIRKY